MKARNTMTLRGGSMVVAPANKKTAETPVVEHADSLAMAAQAMGRKGGKATSDAKTAASRENGRKGGRPRFQWAVTVAYECRLGERGKVLSKHTKYELAELAVKRSGFADWLKIDQI